MNCVVFPVDCGQFGLPLPPHIPESRRRRPAGALSDTPVKHLMAVLCCVEDGDVQRGRGSEGAKRYEIAIEGLKPPLDVLMLDKGHCQRDRFVAVSALELVGARDCSQHADGGGIARCLTDDDVVEVWHDSPSHLLPGLGPVSHQGWL